MTASEFAELKASIIGQPIDEVRRVAEQAGFVIRVRRDGNNRYLGTCDVVRNRINVGVDNGVVTEVSGFG